MRATYSVLLVLSAIAVLRVLGEVLTKSFLQPLDCQMRQAHLKHRFLNMAKCLIPLLGFVLLTKVNAKVTFTTGPMNINVAPELHQCREVLLELPEKVI